MERERESSIYYMQVIESARTGWQLKLHAHIHVGPANRVCSLFVGSSPIYLRAPMHLIITIGIPCVSARLQTCTRNTPNRVLMQIGLHMVIHTDMFYYRWKQHAAQLRPRLWRIGTMYFEACLVVTARWETMSSMFVCVCESPIGSIPGGFVYTFVQVPARAPARWSHMFVAPVRTTYVCPIVLHARNKWGYDGRASLRSCAGSERV